MISRFYIKNKRVQVFLLFLLSLFFVSVAINAQENSMTEEVEFSTPDRLRHVVESEPDDLNQRRVRLLEHYDEISGDLSEIIDAENWTALERFATWIIGERGDPSMCQHLVAQWDRLDEDPVSQMSAASAIARCGGGFEHLRTMLAAEIEPVFRVKAAFLLGLHQDQERIAEITAMLSDPVFDEYQLFITLALGMLGDSSVAAELRPMLSRRELRDYAAIALARNGDTSVSFDLGFALANEDPIVRYFAMIALVELHPSSGRRALEAVLEDPQPRIRNYATRAHRLWDRR